MYDENKEIASYIKYDYTGNKIWELSAKDYQNNLEFTKKYKYGYKGNLVLEELSNGAKLGYTYDFLNRKTSYINPKGKVSKYYYNNFGYLIREENPHSDNNYSI